MRQATRDCASPCHVSRHVSNPQFFLQATREEVPLKKKLDFIQGRQNQAKSLQQRVAELLHLITGWQEVHRHQHVPFSRHLLAERDTIESNLFVKEFLVNRNQVRLCVHISSDIVHPIGAQS